MLEITKKSFPEISLTKTDLLTEKIQTMLPYDFENEGAVKHNHFARYGDEIYVSKDTFEQIMRMKKILPSSHEDTLYNFVLKEYTPGDVGFRESRRNFIESYYINISLGISVDQKIKNLFVGMILYSLGKRLNDVFGD